MEWRRIAWTSAAALVCGGTWLGAQQTGSGQTPVFRTGVELVTVEVGVVDKQGRPLADLDADDFSVTVDGRKRRVVTAEFVDVAGSRVPADPAGRGGGVSTNAGAGVGRLFVFIVDQHTIEPGTVRHVANAASLFFDQLTFADRSALLLMPTGPNVEFTWAHDRVRDALKRVVGLNTPGGMIEFPSLTEARDIVNRNMMALRTAAMRECGGGSMLAGGFDAFGGPTSGGSPGGAGPPQGSGGSPTSGGDGGVGPPGGGGAGGAGGGSTGGGGSGGGAVPGGGGGGSGGGGRRPAGGGVGADDCMRELQLRAEWAWRNAHMTSLSSITALRRTLAHLAKVRGDKTVVLISGGWPLDEREQQSLLSMVAAEAAAARATIFSMFVPGTRENASRRLISSTPVNDQWLHAWPLEILAGMSGGASYRVEVGAEAAFERMGRELAGYYRIGVEKNPGDESRNDQRMKVQVSRRGATVRSRDIFDARSYEDRDWSARLSSALEAPVPATGIGLKVTSYVASDPDDLARLKLVLAGEASRVEPGDAVFQLLIQDEEGRRVVSDEQPAGQPTGDGLAFSAHLPLQPGSYIIRVAVMDGQGRVGSVDHRVDLRQTDVGPLVATGPMLVRVPRAQGVRPHLAIGEVRQDERLAVQLDLEGNEAQLSSAEVVFEIAESADGAALVQASGLASSSRRTGWLLSQAVADIRTLAAGDYIVRARIRSGAGQLGELTRALTVLPAPAAALADAHAAEAAEAAAPPAAIVPANHALVTVPRFAVEQALASQVLNPFLDRVAARADARSPMIRDLVARARTTGLDGLAISDTLAAEYPVASFLRGLTLLSESKLEHAANAFRAAMRASPDFYPAMVYLGVCYAAGGNDKEAAGAWRTALIKEGDALALHTLLADALLRQQRAELAHETLVAAREQWPEDDGLKRRYVLAALMVGRHAEGLQALDELVAIQAEDEPTLAAGLLITYQALAQDRPVEDTERDRARMRRLADAYRAINGPSLPLIESWVEAIGK